MQVAGLKASCELPSTYFWDDFRRAWDCKQKGYVQFDDLFLKMISEKEGCSMSYLILYVFHHGWEVWEGFLLSTGTFGICWGLLTGWTT